MYMQSKIYFFSNEINMFEKMGNKKSTFSGEIEIFEKLMEHEIYIFQMKYTPWKNWLK